MKKITGYTAPIWMPFVVLAVALALHYVAGVDMDEMKRSFAAMMSLLIGTMGGIIVVAVTAATED